MLNEKQTQLLETVESFISQNGYSPTVRELAEQLDMSPAGIFQNLKRLRQAGKVQWLDGAPRTLRVVQNAG